MARKKSDIDDLGERAQAGTRAVKSLSGAFGDLSKNGKLTSSAIMQFSAALAQAHPALGLVGAGIGLVAAQSERFKALEMADKMAEVAEAAKAVRLESDILVASIKAATGESGAFRAKLEEAAKTEVLIANRTKMLGDELQRLADLEAKAAITTAQYAAKVAFANQANGNAIRLLEKRRHGLEQEITAVRKARTANEQYMSDYDRHFAIMRAVAKVESDRARFLKEIEVAARAARDATSADTFEIDLQRKILEDRNAVYALSQERMQALGAMAQQALGGVAVAAFDQYAEAMDRAIDGQNMFTKSSGRAMQVALANTLHSIGRQAAVEAGMEGARALAAYAVGSPTASIHAASAAAFLAVAASAGVGAGAMSVKPAGGGGAGAGSDRGGRSGRDSGDGGSRNTYVFIGTMDTQARKDFIRQLDEERAEGG